MIIHLSSGRWFFSENLQARKETEEEIIKSIQRLEALIKRRNEALGTALPEDSQTMRMLTRLYEDLEVLWA